MSDLADLMYPQDGGRWKTGDDPVNHPAHYEAASVECIDVLLETQGAGAVEGFCVCNAMKYLYRHRYKGGDEDIQKAIWYLKKYLDLRELA